MDAVGPPDTGLRSTRAEPVPAEAVGPPKLVFRNGASRGTVLVLEQDRTSIGRDARNDVAVSDEIVSSRHALIVRGEDGAFRLHDQGSKNGTFLNGHRLREPAVLREDDVFCLAHSGPEVQFTYEEPSLPSLLATCTSTLARSGSWSALKELLPGGRNGVVTASGVRRLVDRRLEEASRRSRWIWAPTVLGGIAVALLAALLLLQAFEVFPGMAPGRGAPPGGEGAGSPAASASRVPRAEIELEVRPIFGSLFHSYRERPIGSVRVVNPGEEPLRDLRLEARLYLRRKGRSEPEPLLVERPVYRLETLPPGEPWAVELAPKLANAVLSPVDQEATAEVRLRAGGEPVESVTRAVMIYGQNAMDWSEPRRVAAFIDPEDPGVRALVNRAWTASRAPAEGSFPPAATVKAVTILTAIARQELRYLADGRSASTFDGEGETKDRVKYPLETLREGTGDCDDLSVLGCAALQAAGVRTAVLVAPGHVLFMFESGLETADPEASPFDARSVIAWEGRLWLPVESTSLAGAAGGFSAAWADAWRFKEAAESGDLRIVDVPEAWSDYRPLRPEVDPGTQRSLREREWIPEGTGEAVTAALDALRSIHLENLRGKVEEIRRDFDGAAGAQAVARLYTRSGLYESARQVLEDAVFDGPAPATPAAVRAWDGEVGQEHAILLADLAAIAARTAGSAEDYELAAALYEQSLRGFPEGWPEAGETMLRLALVHRLEGDLRAEATWRERAFRVDPGLEALYHDLLRGDGSVAGDSVSIHRFLLEEVR